MLEVLRLSGLMEEVVVSVGLVGSGPAEPVSCSRSAISSLILTLEVVWISKDPSLFKRYDCPVLVTFGGVCERSSRSSVAFLVGVGVGWWRGRPTAPTAGNLCLTQV